MQSDPTVNRFAPSPALAHAVREILVVRAAAARRDAHFPDAGLVAAFTFAGECGAADAGGRFPEAALTGVHRALRRHVHARGHAVLLVRFVPGGAAGAFGAGLDAVAGRTIDLRDVSGSRGDLAECSARIADAATDRERVAAVEGFLARVWRAPRDERRIATAVERLGGADRVRVDTLARALGWSERAFERRFRGTVGVSPRAFAALARLERALRLRATGLAWTAVAHAAGFSDQAHFNHEFRRVAGTSPGAYFAATPA